MIAEAAMTVQITLIGLGQIGGSIGLALGGKSGLRRVGVDKNSPLAKAALSLGAIDEIGTLPEAVRSANIVLLCLPLSEMQETLRQIGPELQPNTVVMDTAPSRQAMAEWIKESITEGRFHVGLMPALSLAALSSVESGFNAADPKLFQRTVMSIYVPPGTPAEVVQLAFQFCALIGAKPMLTDLQEADGLSTSVHLLPQFVSAALLNATVDAPGWIEARKLASRVYSEITGGLAFYDDVASLRIAALSNRARMVHALDMLMESLQELRDAIQAGDEQAITAGLEDAFDSRERWLEERTTADWLKEGGDAAGLPNVGEQLMQSFFGSRIIDRFKRKDE
jgi:prephenate dehydrogenase